MFSLLCTSLKTTVIKVVEVLIGWSCFSNECEMSVLILAGFVISCDGWMMIKLRYAAG